MNGAVKPDGDGLFEYGEHSHQKEYPKDHVPKEEVPYHEGKPLSHNYLDSKDERSIKNRLAAEERHRDAPDTEEVQELKQDPTLPAKMHGNKPSKGAIIDAEIIEEEKKELGKKAEEVKQSELYHEGTHHGGKAHHH